MSGFCSKFCWRMAKHAVSLDGCTVQSLMERWPKPVEPLVKLVLRYLPATDAAPGIADADALSRTP